MACNFLVVLGSDKGTQPIANTGALYNWPFIEDIAALWLALGKLLFR